MGQGNPFHGGGFPGNSFQTDPSRSFLVMSEGNGTFDYVFGTANGIFAVHNPNGRILGLKKAATNTTARTNFRTPASAVLLSV
jgi:hypothetical protein